MSALPHLPASLAENWPVWLLSAVLIVAAVIDGWKLKVPNWITFPLVLGGWVYSTAYFGWEGLGWSLMGTIVGLAAVAARLRHRRHGRRRRETAGGGGRVGLGHHDSVCVLRVGDRRRRDCLGDGALAARLAPPHVPVLDDRQRDLRGPRSRTRWRQMAAGRKSAMLLLPYGIPIAIGSIAYFVWAGMLL